jgi:hypothetical protein
VESRLGIFQSSFWPDAQLLDAGFRGEALEHVDQNITADVTRSSRYGVRTVMTIYLSTWYSSSNYPDPRVNSYCI